jgi:hypothetical protein
MMAFIFVFEGIGYLLRRMTSRGICVVDNGS